jgi:uncharacterized protein YjbK
MKFLCFAAAVIFALTLPACTETGAVDYNNPVIQQALSDAEQIALTELTHHLDRGVRARSIAHQDVTIKDPVIIGAMASAEAKIKRKHPEMSDADIHAVVLRAAKKKIDSSP